MDVSGAPHIWDFFERCTMEARRVVFHARQAVIDFGGDAISAEHILCGLFEADVLASRHFAALPMPASELRARVKGLLGVSNRSSGAIDVALADEAKRILDRAWAEAEAAGQRKILSDHLLLGLLAGESAAAVLLKANGVAANAVRDSIPMRDPDEDER
jgi:ATP-dependent Clp protease ATP-binding subunit ClpB